MEEKKNFPTPRGVSANRAKAKYNSKTYDQMMVNVPKGQRSIIDAAAAEQGYKNRTEFIMAAIQEKINRYNMKSLESYTPDNTP